MTSSLDGFLFDLALAGAVRALVLVWSIRSCQARSAASVISWSCITKKKIADKAWYSHPAVEAFGDRWNSQYERGRISH